MEFVGHDFAARVCAQFNRSGMDIVSVWLRLRCDRFRERERLIPRSGTESFGTVEQGDDRVVSFHLDNLAGHPVHLLGAKVSCICLVVDGLPQTIPVGGSYDLKVHVSTSLKAGDMEASVRVYTDDQSQAPTVLSVIGRVNKRSTASTTRGPS